MFEAQLEVEGTRLMATHGSSVFSLGLGWRDRLLCSSRLGRAWGQLSQKRMVSFRKQFGGAPKVKHSCNKVPEILLPGIYPRQLKTGLFIAALFRIAKRIETSQLSISW